MRQENIVTEYEFREFAKESESVLRLAEDFIKDHPDTVAEFKIKDAKDCIAKMLDYTVISAVYEGDGDGRHEFEIFDEDDEDDEDYIEAWGIEWYFATKVAYEFMKTEGVEDITVVRD